MASISSLGIGSGLDLNGLLDQLESAERQKLTPIVQQQKSYQAQISAFGRLESALDKFQEAAAKLADVDGFQAVSSDVSGEAFTVSSGTNSVPGRYQIEITQLAQAETLALNGVEDQTTELGAGTLTITVGGEEKPIAIADGESSLEAIRDTINAEGIGVTASIINDGSGNPYRLVLTSDKTGDTSDISISANATSSDALKDLLTTTDSEGNATGMQTTVQGANAILSVNGIDIVSESNRVEGALQDVTLNLNAITEEGSPETLTVSRDTGQITDDVTAFVEAYNALQTTMDELTAFDSASGSAGLLLGDNTMRNVESQLRSVISGSVEGDLQLLSDIGIELTLDGTLELDEERLEELVNDDLDSLSAFFSGGLDGEGLADRLDTTLTGMLEDEGLLSSATSGLETSIESLDERYARTEERIGTTVERYRMQFADMDMLVAEMNSTMSYLSQQFAAMNAQLGRD